MAQKKKKGRSPKQETPKRRKSTSQIIFSIVAVLMVLAMIVPYLIGLFQ